ncbi:hypothetical protein SETIT_6G088700v2 [Setaria italica]|uniref:Uncharacterized protein n=4 Tax=Setaria TaxID=4554 RepID=A0A368RJJ5_SETIT|nr:hypothetical protein SETIT_6G088700v2 [Setaria italica]TKW09340.1 hypothetical protein SEVIR_6G087700v2 [Setaria viridis]
MHHHPSTSKKAVVTEAAVDVCLAGAAVAGAALLAWWAVAFHPTYAHLWMVPLGLVLAGTPPVVCLALRCSGDGGPRVPLPRSLPTVPTACSTYAYFSPGAEPGSV